MQFSEKYTVSNNSSAALRRCGLPAQAAKRRVILLGVLLTSICSLAQTGAGSHFVVIVPVLDMCSAPTADSDVVSQAIYGSNVLQIDQKSNWAKIRTQDQYSGWVRLSGLNAQAHQYAASGNVAQVNSLSANLYREADVTAHRPVLTVPFETRLAVIGEGEGNAVGWLQVSLPDNGSAWIQKGDVDRSLKLLTIPESIALAKRFLGVTYTWGGSSSMGFDCSGFTQMLVRSRGIIMPRDADLQAAWEGVVAVDRKHLRAGDLLFFGDSTSHITHTGMFLGHGQFIHDTVHGHPGVQISRLRDQPWASLLVACRRIK